MKQAIDKLKQLAQDNNSLADDLESGKIELKGCTPERFKDLIGTYRFWSHCLYTAAWLLEQAE